ncbi:MAG TPA: hypothetical protein ENG54_00760 [Thermofilum sp.]|nr:hypothetical protein [Thermofilum sp.]
MEKWRAELRKRIPQLVFNAIVAFFFYLMSNIMPSLVRGITLPGITIEPFNDLGWLMWAFLFVVSMAFAANTLYHLIKLIDPVVSRFTSKLGIKPDPAKRVLQDVTYILMAIVVSEALSILAEGVPGYSHVLRVAISVVALIIIIMLIYDLSKNIYKYIEEKIDAIVDRL